MDTLDDLIRKGYRIYKMRMEPTNGVKDYFKNQLGLLVEYHKSLKVITVRDVKSESAI